MNNNLWAASGESEMETGLVNWTRRLFYRSPAYKFILSGTTPKRLLGTPIDLLQGDPGIGTEILSGRHSVGGHIVCSESFGDAPLSFSHKASTYLNDFSWLRHLRAVGSDEARAFARNMIAAWIAANHRWHQQSWRPDVLGERLTNWLTHFGFMSAGANSEFEPAFLASVGRQVKHMGRPCISMVSGADRITALKGFVLAGLSLSNGDKYLALALSILAEEVGQQVPQDGCHFSRSPETHARVLGDLIVVRDTFDAAKVEIPDWLTAAVERLARRLRSFRHGDGGLALFNGSTADSASLLDLVLTRSKVRGQPTERPTSSGFFRLSAARTILIIDAGIPPGRTANQWAHAGTLSFEMSVGKERLLVNCGANRRDDTKWRSALRSTAAHSTVTVDNVNSSELTESGGFSRRPSVVSASRREIEGSVIIDASHDGYATPFGLTHRRLLMLAPDGHEVRGEDSLIGSGGQVFVARFHLHPDVHASVIHDGRAVLLKLRRSGWVFTTDGETLTLEDSVYFGNGRNARRCLQIVVEGDLEGAGATLCWKLSRIEG